MRIRTRLGVIAALAALGAGTGVAQAQGPPANGGPIMPLSQVQAGMNCTGYTVIQGTTISSFDVQIMGVVAPTTGQGARILISVSGPAVAETGIAEGFSGSPIYCPATDGTMENIGAISEGIYQYGNNVALATPIQQMLGEPVTPPSSVPRVAFRTRPLLGPLTIGGLSPTLLSLVERAGQKAGRQVTAAPTSGVPSYPVQPLVPGASVAASYSTGEVAMGAVGTVTYRSGQDVYVFGHELDGAGRRSLYLQDAYVYTVVNDPDPTLIPSYKLAVGGHTVGTVTDDTPNAVVGVVGTPPGQIPVTVTARDTDTNASVAETTDVADETDVGFPLGTSLLDTIAPLAVGQGAIDAFNGPPAAESGTMCLQIAIREHNTDLHFCDRYVGIGAPGDGSLAPPEVSNGAATDVTTALSLLDSVQFANLHVTGITANISEHAGLAEGQIVSATAPHRVTPGQLIPVRLKVQLYRSTTVRTYSFKVKVPASAHGSVKLVLRGAPSVESQAENEEGGGSLADILTISLGGGEPTGPETPNSLAQLKKDFAAIPPYDGVSAKFGRAKEKPVYRNPSLLVTGSATIKLRGGR